MSKENKNKDFWRDLQEESLDLCINVLRCARKKELNKNTAQDIEEDPDKNMIQDIAQEAKSMIIQFCNKGQVEASKQSEICSEFSDIKQCLNSVPNTTPKPNITIDSDPVIKMLSSSRETSKTRPV